MNSVISLVIGILIVLVPTFIAHEVGHVLAAWLLGYKITKLRLNKVEFDPKPKHTTHILLITTAGILAGLIPIILIFPHWMMFISYSFGCVWDILYIRNCLSPKNIFPKLN